MYGQSNTFSQWCGDGVTITPSGAHSIRNRILVYANNVGPFSDCFGLPMKNQPAIPTSVSCLCNSRGPFAVFGRVVAIVVDSFNRMFGRRSRPHVGVKSLERLIPSVANLDSSAAVAFPILTVAVAAPGTHPTPCVPFRRDHVFSSHAVRCAALSCLLRTEAATAYTASVAKRGAVNRNYLAAIAFAEPFSCFVSA